MQIDQFFSEREHGFVHYLSFKENSGFISPESSDTLRRRSRCKRLVLNFATYRRDDFNSGQRICDRRESALAEQRGRLRGMVFKYIQLD